MAAPLVELYAKVHCPILPSVGDCINEIAIADGVHLDAAAVFAAPNLHFHRGAAANVGIQHGALLPRRAAPHRHPRPRR